MAQMGGKIPSTGWKKGETVRPRPMPTALSEPVARADAPMRTRSADAKWSARGDAKGGRDDLYRLWKRANPNLVWTSGAPAHRFDISRHGAEAQIVYAPTRSADLTEVSMRNICIFHIYVFHIRIFDILVFAYSVFIFLCLAFGRTHTPGTPPAR